MKKLINLQVYPAQNVICGYQLFSLEGVDNCDFKRGIARDDAMRGFMIPSHIVVGVFDDGCAIVSGVMSINDINPVNKEVEDISDYYERLFAFRYFLSSVDKYSAKALVRGMVYELDVSEEVACKNLLARLQKAGVSITEDAVKYLRKHHSIKKSASSLDRK